MLRIGLSDITCSGAGKSGAADDHPHPSANSGYTKINAHFTVQCTGPIPLIQVGSMMRARLNLPPEGFAPRSIGPTLIGAHGSVDQPLTVGLYGGWGQPAGVQTSIGPLEVTGLEYWFTTVDGAAFLHAWATDEGYATTGRWDNLVTFVWPHDRAWFLHIDPDAFHTSLYAGLETLGRLTATDLEIFQPDR